MTKQDICPICGASSRRNCDLPEMSGIGDIECQWELDPDILREDAEERRRMNQGGRFSGRFKEYE